MKIGKILLALAFCGGSFMVQANTNATGPNVVKDVNLSSYTQQAIFDFSSRTNEGDKSAFENAHKAFEENGDPIASRLLGTMYYSGRGVTVDKGAALDYFLIAADVDAEAAYMAGFMLLRGDGVSADIYEGTELMSQAAEMGSSHAQLEMVRYSLDQALIEKDPTIKSMMEKNSFHYGKKCAVSQKECRKVLGYIFEHGLAGVQQSASAAKQMYDLSN